MYGPSFKYRDKRSIIVNEAALCTSASLIFVAWHLHSFWDQTIEIAAEIEMLGGTQILSVAIVQYVAALG